LQKLHAALHQYEQAIVGHEPLEWWSQGVTGMPGLSAHPYGGEVIFLVNANATMNYTYRHVDCSGGGGAAVEVPLWSVSIVDGKTCAVVFNSADDLAADGAVGSERPAPEPGPADRVGAPGAGWEYYSEPTNLSWW